MALQAHIDGHHGLLGAEREREETGSFCLSEPRAVLISVTLLNEGILQETKVNYIIHCQHNIITQNSESKEKNLPPPPPPPPSTTLNAAVNWQYS